MNAKTRAATDGRPYWRRVAAICTWANLMAGLPVVAIDYPGPPPGAAMGACSPKCAVLENDALAMRWNFEKGLRPVELVEKRGSKIFSLKDAQCFRLVLGRTPDSRMSVLDASCLSFAEPPSIRRLEASRDSVRFGDRYGGWELLARLNPASRDFKVVWRAILRDGANYIRQEVTVIASDEPVELVEIGVWDAPLPQVEVVGKVDGSPIAGDAVFFGVEHPAAINRRNEDGLILCSYPFRDVVVAAEPLTVGSVIGVFPPGQRRRGFLHYIERERAHPFRPFLHHNNGEQLGLTYWGLIRLKKNEEAAEYRSRQESHWLEIIGAVGEQLAKRRGVRLDAFAHDYEWDDENLVWQFHDGFPDGFRPAAREASKFDSALGVWLSPWGGYPGKAARVRSGRAQGFETNQGGLSLAGCRYYGRFRAACMNLLRDHGVRYFKFDGFAGSNSPPGPGEYRSDVDALWRLMGELRQARPDVFINPSSGTWASPFWLLRADCIWRGGGDTGIAGAKGSERQQWITYRDFEVHNRVLANGPLYPISSLMIHGIMINGGGRVKTFEERDMLDEIRSFFATGVNLQELYISPELMTPAAWDALAECANWSRSNADVLADTHWVGGDPAKGEIYGWAAWSPRKGILSLRNPSDQPASISIDIASVFELPAGAPRSYLLKSPWEEDASRPAIRMEAGRGRSFELRPFEVMVFEAGPQSSAGVGHAPDLVAHWTFDEADGAVARDVTGNGHDATVKNTQWIRSPRGHALRFDGRDDVARYGGVDSMNMSGDASLAVWVRLDAAVAPDTHRLIFGDGGGGVDRNLNLRLDGSGGLRFEWGNGKESSSLVAPGSLMNGTWKHIVVVADSRSRTMTMYVDGEMVARADEARPLDRAPVKERTTGWFYNGFFKGDLDDIRIYRRALSEEQVRQLFASGADVQAGVATATLNGSNPVPCAELTAGFRNLSQQPRTVRIRGGGAESQEFTLRAGEARNLPLGAVAVSDVWPDRKELLICGESEPWVISVRAGEFEDEMSLSMPKDLLLEPIRLRVDDPWQRDMAERVTGPLKVDVDLAIGADELAGGVLQLTLTSKETGKEVAHRELKSPKNRQTLAFETHGLQWGAYGLGANFTGADGREWTRVSRQVIVLPHGPQRVRALNNFVTELMDAGARGMLGGPIIEFMNPRDGWVWFRAAGPCGLKLKDDELLGPGRGHEAREAMRLLPAGKHALHITGNMDQLLIRAVPALVYNIHPSSPMISPFGPNTWDRLKKHMLPNCNMIESGTVDTDEYKEWLAQGKMWLANIQAPGLIDDKGWPMERLIELWLHPGKSTAHAERPGLDIAKLSGVQVDEYYPGAKSVRGELARAMPLSVARLSAEPAFANKLWIPFFAGKYGATDPLFMKVLIGSGWPFSEEVYVGEMPTEAENARNITSHFLGVAQSYEAVQRGAVRRMIFTPMYAYLPYCTANRCPGANFHIHLQMQMQLLATDPAFFGLWGVQPYRSNYVDEETLNCMGRLLRHYCIDGRTAPLVDGPYELHHLKDPDFEEGLAHWEMSPAEEHSIFGGRFTDYGELQGRYPASAFGDTFACMRRSSNKPNTISQRLVALEAGKSYSVKVITGDHGDLGAGRSRRSKCALSIEVDGADLLPGGFSHTFRSGSRGPRAFSTEKPFWMTYHWLRFRAKETAANLRLSDWAKDNEPGGAAGQETMISFVEIQPMLEEGVFDAQQ